MTHNSSSETNIIASWTPNLLNPVFKKDNLILKEALNLSNIDEKIHLITPFVPNEIIHRIDLLEKGFQSFQAVLMLLNISDFSTLFKKYVYNENEGSLSLTTTLNDYIQIVSSEINNSGGDLLQFSGKYYLLKDICIAQGLLVVWKVRDNDFVFKTVQNVIIRAINIQNSITALKVDVDEILTVNIVISAGDVIFSLIGNDEVRHFVIFGSPLGELKYAKKVSLPNDLVLSMSAWQHCTPSQYEYVIKDAFNIKIIKVLEQSKVKLANNVFMSSNVNTNSDGTMKKKFIINPSEPSLSYKTHATSTNEESYSQTVITNTKEEHSTINPNLGTRLKSYLMKPVIQQIEKNLPLEFLMEIGQITIIALDVIFNKCPDDEFILLVDKCFLLLHGIVTQYAGCINVVNLYDRNTFFCIVFGIFRCNDEDQFKIGIGKNRITCAMQVLQTVKSIDGVQGVFLGVSTGVAYRGVIGSAIRKYYAIVGPPVDKAIGIMEMSYNKISCDYDTVLHSRISKDQFRSRGVRIIRQMERYYIYEYIVPTEKDVTSSLDYCYPILGRLQELEDFGNILDEIGVADRDYAGLLIEGSERSGKSRLLDAFVASVCNRQIRPIKLSLHVTYAEKAHAVIHHIMLQIFEAEDCNTVEEREKALYLILGNVLALKDFCYLNSLMRVRFPLSDTYCSDSDSQRHMKVISIFETILKQLETKICILLDDVQHMDHMSWKFLSSALNNDNIIVAMTILKPYLSNDLSREIYEDQRLMKRTLSGLDLDLFPAFACQFLNVIAIPRKLSRILCKCKDGHIGWCEAFLTLILQNDSLDFIRILPSQMKRRDIMFPDATLVTKLPVDLTPEEVAPPLRWSQMSYLDICVTNERYSEISDIDYDMRGLMEEIYNRMNPYEQSFITCGATLGTVFKRSVLQNVMLNEIPPHTIKTVSKMIRMRILECASLQRRDFYSENLVLCILKKRKTFSDMHHLVTCSCHISQAFDNRSFLYAHCKTLEFKVDLFRKLVYDIQSDEEKQICHARAARIYNKNAQKCISCGSGTFLRVPSTNVSMKKGNRLRSLKVSLVRRKTAEDQNDKVRTARRTTLFMGGIASLKKPEFIDYRRISIMPTYLDDEEDEALRNEDTRESVTDESSRFWKWPISISLEKVRVPSHSSCLEEFSHIDYRNCHCDGIISCLFWKLHQHIENSGEKNEMLDFLLEYSAGLIQIAQPSHAIQLLSIAAEKNETVETSESISNNAKNNITNKGIILALTGDAYNALGNYALANKYYTMAVTLGSTPSKINKAVCTAYSMIMSKMYCKLPDFSRYSINEISGQLAIRNLELASYMRRLCIVLMIKDKLKVAKLFALRSLKLGFSSVGSFLEKGEVFLVAIRVLRRTRSIELIRRIERLMLIVISTKTSWTEVEEMAMVANVYLTIYQIRALRGELDEAVNMGIKVLRISRVLHLNNLMLIIMPSLIQIMLWTKRINRAVDLMRELYSLAEDDIDLSAKIWYYALSLEFLLDAGIVLESYEICFNYYNIYIASRSKFCILRDLQSLRHLSTCLWLYQLRMGYTTENTVIYSAETYMKDDSWDNFSHIFSCSKGLECYLMILLCYINIKHSNDWSDLIQDIYKIIKHLNNVSRYAIVIKPHLYLLMAYLNIIRGRKSIARFYLRKAQKHAASQGNKLIVASIKQNQRMWIKKVYDDMTRYWLKHVESANFIIWQYIHRFNIDKWSTILYALPTPDSYKEE